MKIKEIAVWIKNYGWSVSVEDEDGSKQNFVVFDNRQGKKNENAPDYKLMPAKPKEDTTSEAF